MINYSRIIIQWWYFSRNIRRANKLSIDISLNILSSCPLVSSNPSQFCNIFNWIYCQIVKDLKKLLKLEDEEEVCDECKEMGIDNLLARLMFLKKYHQQIKSQILFWILQIHKMARSSRNRPIIIPKHWLCHKVSLNDFFAFKSKIGEDSSKTLSPPPYRKGPFLEEVAILNNFMNFWVWGTKKKLGKTLG